MELRVCDSKDDATRTLVTGSQISGVDGVKQQEEIICQFPNLKQVPESYIVQIEPKLESTPGKPKPITGKARAVWKPITDERRKKEKLDTKKDPELGDNYTHY